MTPKEKALELYNKYETLCRDFTRGVSIKEFAKESALVAVDEILKSNEDWDLEQNIWCDTGFFGDCQMYWIAVKQELEKL